MFSSNHGSFEPPFFAFYWYCNPLLFFLYSSSEWSLQNWPFHKVTEQLHTEIINLGHWDIHPLAAYTPNDMLIHLSNYEKELAGAMVVMSFCLKYALPWNSVMRKYEKVQCMTKILQNRVITKVVPITHINTASKRAAPSKPKFGSPAKKHVKWYSSSFIRTINSFI